MLLKKKGLIVILIFLKYELCDFKFLYLKNSILISLNIQFTYFSPTIKFLFIFFFLLFFSHHSSSTFSKLQLESLLWSQSSFTINDNGLKKERVKETENFYLFLFLREQKKRLEKKIKNKNKIKINDKIKKYINYIFKKSK